MIRKFGFFIFVFYLFSLLGCSSFPRPVSSHRKGFLDRMNAESGAPPSKSAARIQTRVLTRVHQKPAEFLTPPSPGSFQWPLHAVEITSPFGKRGRQFHEGLDLKAAPGTPVYAAQSGKVLYADSKIRGYGKMVVIRHKGSLATIYAHNRKVLVRRGDIIKQGQMLAFSGSTGHTRGPHLHFEIRNGLKSLNPLKLLPLINAPARLAMK